MVMGGATNYSRFVLLDANIVAGYYLPESLQSVNAKKRVNNIIEAVRKGGAPEILLFIPRLCIPEVFAVFAKHYFARWDKTVQKRLPRRLTQNQYERILKKFRNDLRNADLLREVELSRHHILATDLISPIDANYQHYRNRGNARKNRAKRMMGAADHTIIGMGIGLSRIHGREKFAILTADHRLADILTRACSVRRSTAERLGLVKTAGRLGLDWGKDVYPRVLHLTKAKQKELRDFFGVWPLSEKPISKKPLTSISLPDCELLAKLRRQSGVGRDSLPYTKKFEMICREFEKMKGQAVDRNVAWKAIGRIEKKGKSKKIK
jgi:hypothetical protein